VLGLLGSRRKLRRQRIEQQSQNAKYGLVVNGLVDGLVWANFQGTNVLTTPILMQDSGGYSPRNVKFLGGTFKQSRATWPTFKAARTLLPSDFSLMA